MNCNFELKDNKYVCISCGYTSKVNAKKNCGGVPIVKKVMNFTKAITKHTITSIVGEKVYCSESQIKDRLSICNNCNLFKKFNEEGTAGICTHNSCGCTISDNIVFLNKLRWADQECPLKKWSVITKESPENNENGV